MAYKHRQSFVKERVTLRSAVLRRFDVRAGNVVLLAAIVAGLAAYLVLNTQAATKGFSIKSLERRIAGLEDQRKKLEFEAVNRQSMDNLDSQVSALGFVSVGNIEYLAVGNAAVAVK